MFETREKILIEATMTQDELEKIVSRVVGALKEKKNSVPNDGATQPDEAPVSSECSSSAFPVLQPIRQGATVLVTEEALKKLVPNGGTILVSGKFIITPSAADFIRKKGVTIEKTDEALTADCFSSVHPELSATIVIGADHRGFALKEIIKRELTKLGYRTLDVGTDSPDRCDYPDYASAVAQKVSSGEANLGIAIDSAGIGSAIAANKISGVRAAVCWNETTAAQARLHNDANIICIGADNLATTKAMAMVKKFIQTSYAPSERYDRRIKKIAELERK